MNSVLAGIGLFTIILLLLFLIKKISDILYLKRIKYVEDTRVYQAARQYGEGSSIEIVRYILSNCVDLDMDDVEEILQQAYPHRSDADGGYSAFIKAVNDALGEEVYSKLHFAAKQG